MTRLIIVSNRLPVTLSVRGDQVALRPSTGGLATAMTGVHSSNDSLWIGYVGDTGKLRPEGRERLAGELQERRLVPVSLSASEVSLYYDGFSNAVLWPLFHYLLEKVRIDTANEWRAYKAVNEHFADAIAAVLRPGDAVWVHDYHLMLVPGLVRARREDTRIGFFLHVPWPSSDVFRILPHREEILESLLSCDVVGFHTEGYRHNFIHSAAKVLGVGLGVDSLEWQDRTVRIGVYPIGIDVASFERESHVVDRGVRDILAGTPGKKRALGVDRLDYTKGLPRRLLALAQLLEREPQLRGQLHFIQVAVPTREKVDAYTELRRSVNELVGRINSQYGSPTGSPVQLLYRSVSSDDLLALYRAADVMLVTPLRDGMNLVAKEYVASRTSDSGVLVLSEFAGAAAELDAALIVNPYDLGALAAAMRRALFMTPEEQALRMHRLRDVVRGMPVDAWWRSFVDELVQTPLVERAVMTPRRVLDGVIEQLVAAPRRALLLDYDGTLVPLAPLPDLAHPDPELLILLRQLSGLPGTEVHVVSGRSRDTLDAWLGPLPVWLHAEHGFWSRAPAQSWLARGSAPAALAQALEIMRRHARGTPGALVEPKTASAAFHYRGADPHLAEARVRALRAELGAALGPGVELLDGHKVLEVRAVGIDKARVVELIADGPGSRPLLFAAGDDRTDEDMFGALGPEDLSVRVGAGNTRARFRVATPFELRALLARLL